MLNIVIAELIEGNYVLYQGDLSTKMLEKLRICVKPIALRPAALKAGSSSQAFAQIPGGLDDPAALCRKIVALPLNK
ncbi:hypothetical protein N5O88_11365 [Pseudomonas sp. GD03721]|jgi:hypothetical protein|nr:MULTISPECIES: hypothetical protein [Pseudomonas]MDH1443556.1 hypothetical protein [Pseudomonas sp. GD03722]WGF99759.1 hypothetical protein N5O88_11365 [Pseudomonas sp. GD03721]WGG03924.1 hypothetical protein N5O87_11375 [Pseudomonas sp. GD03919]